MAGRSGGRVAGVLLALLLVVGAGWWFRADLVRLLGRSEAVEVSPEAAAEAEAKLERLRAAGDTASLSSAELTSLLRYRAPAGALEGVTDPTIRLAGDTVRLSGHIATDRLPSHPELDRVRAFLPDTAPLELRGEIRELGEGRVALDLQGVEFAGVPIPARYYPSMLERLGRRELPGLPRTAIALRLPPGVGGARVEHGRLILTP